MFFPTVGPKILIDEDNRPTVNCNTYSLPRDERETSRRSRPTCKHLRLLQHRVALSATAVRQTALFAVTGLRANLVVELKQSDPDNEPRQLPTSTSIDMALRPRPYASEGLRHDRITGKNSPTRPPLPFVSAISICYDFPSEQGSGAAITPSTSALLDAPIHFTL